MRRAGNTAWQQWIGWLLLIGIIIYLVINHSDDRVRKVCRRAQVGSSVAELNVYARELGLNDRIVSTGATPLVEGRPGAYACVIEAVGGVVRDVKFANDTD
jgi:hypothetical protein